MNKRQKEVLQAQLNSEEEVIAQLKSTYGQALRDCEAKIQELSMRADLEPENIQSIIYQKQYQEAIKAQLEGALANLQSDSYATVSDYLTRSYQDGYLGSMYDMQGQGIPLVMPVDQEAVTKAVMLDSKLSTSLYDRLGEDVKAIKKSVRQEVSRGIAQGMTWSNIASNLARNMKHTPFQKAYNNSIRIARTEGHRIQNRAALDAQKRAIDRGAEVVKQWNAVLDGRTRSEHRELDGQIREVGEMFEVAGYKAESPGLFGDPSQDCNCRCCLDQRARWALNCGIVKMDNFSKQTVTFESPEEYAEWKKVYWSDENIAYMRHVTDMEKKYGKNFETVLNSMTDKEYEKYKRLLDNNPMYKTKVEVSKQKISDHVYSLSEYISGGVVYKVDGKHVISDSKPHEKEVAEIIGSFLEKEVNIIPRIVYPQGVSTPDYMIDGKKYDLKEPQGSGKNTLFNMVHKKKSQASNFVFDISKCGLTTDEVEEQVLSLYTSKWTSFVNEVIIMKDGKVIKRYTK